MEPFRPVVDRIVAAVYDRRSSSLCENSDLPNRSGQVSVNAPSEKENELKLGKEKKKKILEGLLARFTADEESRTLFDWISRTASSLAGVIEGREEKLDIPCFEL